MDRSYSRRWVRFGACLLSLAALALFAPGARAQLTVTQTETHTIIPPPPSLAAVLAASPPPGVVIAVDAENTFRPPDRAVPEPGASMERVGWAFDRLVKSFGSVTAIAPPTMVVLNTHLTGENIYVGMPAGQVFELLLASLDSAGWDLLTSDHGIGLDNLQTPDQRAMFMALFPVGQITVQSDDSHRAAADLMKEIRPAQIAKSRLRLALEMRIYIPTDQQGYRGTKTPTKPGAPPHYTFQQNFSTGGDAEMIAGVRIRAELPNSLKRGQLNLNDPRFRAAIGIQGLRTVRSLIEKIGEQTHTELYVDPRLERLSLSVAGTDRAAPASDLLRAAMLCVTGTFRNVGPAFVLTDDVIGVATRREILNRFSARVDAERRQAIKPAQEHLKTLSRRILDLPYAPDSLAIIPAEKKFQMAGSGQLYGTLTAVKAPIDLLPPEQQEIARRGYEEMRANDEAFLASPYAQAHPEASAKYPRATLQSGIMIASAPAVQLDIPGLDAPVDLTFDVHASDLAVLARSASSKEADDHVTAGSAAAALLARFRYPRRVGLVAPRSLSELDSIVDEMPRAGLNELWLVVAPPGTPPGNDRPPAAGALVDEAVTRAKGRGIAVLPAMDLLEWGAAAPADDVDFNVLGENAVQLSAEKRREWLLDHAGEAGLVPPVVSTSLTVSPFASDVQNRLIALEQQIDRPGIAGVVWLQIAPPGYQRSDDEYHVDHSAEFGYRIESRLAFLRQFHADPLDIVMNLQGLNGADVSLPHFDLRSSSAADLRIRWRDYRAGRDLLLLQSLYLALSSRGAAATPPESPKVLVGAPSNHFPAYLEWDNRREAPFIPGEPSEEAIIQSARSQSHLVLLPVSSAQLSSEKLLPLPPQPWDGVVLDLTPAPASAGVPARSSLENLRRLSRLLHPAS